MPAGVPKTGQMTETMARVAARNIAADIDTASPMGLPLEDPGAICVLDAGNNCLIFKAEHLLAATGAPTATSQAHLMAGPQAHWAKLALERIFLITRQRGALVL